MIFSLLERAGHKYKKVGSDYMGVCPSCKEGRKTPNTSFDPEKNCWHCFSCGEKGNLKKLAELLGVDWIQFLKDENVIEDKENVPLKPEGEKPSFRSQKNSASPPENPVGNVKEKEVKKIDFSKKVDIISIGSPHPEWSGDIVSYLRGRCINIDDEYVRRYIFELRTQNPDLGRQKYFEEIYSQGYRLVIPMYDPENRECRSVKIRKITPVAEGESKVRNLAGYSPICFGWDNLNAMHKIKAVLIVEGETDFLSVLSCDFRHVLGVPSATYNFHEEELNALPEDVFLLLDNDAAGQSNTKRLAHQIYSHKKPRRKIYLCSYPAGIKDANELLIARDGDRVNFLADIQTIMEEGTIKRYVPFETSAKLMETMLEELDKKLEEAREEGKDHPDVYTVGTGFQDLDTMLNGGLRSGLYGIAGRPGVGKTCMILSLAKSMLAANPDIYVIVFSLEMTTRELLAQLLSWNSGISRFKILDNDIDRNGFHMLKDALDYSLFNRLIIEDKARTVREFKKVSIDMMNEAEKKCVVLIDYLQQIQPSEKKNELRIAMKEISYELKDFANAYEIPVFVISSTQRELYRQENKIDYLSAFKESGDIEYSLYVGIYLDELAESEIREKGYQLEVGNDGVIVEKAFKVTLMKNRHGTCRNKDGNYMSVDLALSFGNGTLRSLENSISDGTKKLGFMKS